MKDVQETGKASRHNTMLQDCGPDILQLATNYASDYLDYMENLPFDVQRNVTKLRGLDQKCREYVKEVEQLYGNFMKDNDGNLGVPRRSHLLKIQRLLALCKELGDEKISIIQTISEAIESRNKQLEHGCKRFRYAYEPNTKAEHNSKKEKDLKSDSARGSKRSRRQRINNSAESKEKSQHYGKDLEKPAKLASYDDADEPPPKVMLSSSSPDHSSPAAAPVPALTRAALREEDRRAANRLKDNKRDDKSDKDADQNPSATASGKSPNDTTRSVSPSMLMTSSSTSSAASTTKAKGGTSAIVSSSAASKVNNKGKKKKRKSNKHQIETQTSNSGEVSPIIDMPIDPDEPTYCLCQQVSFGQMIGCDNLKCPIEWFHFSCIRLTHKPKGKWYCPDCTVKRKREGKRADNR